MNEELPIFQGKQQILEHIKSHPVTIIIGETGSGKSTQVPQYILDDAAFSRARVIVTQPRRVAAVTLAQRVASERNGKVGDEIGYTVRFEDVSSHDTRVRYMTDGMVLRELMVDNALGGTKVVLLDEAHERTVNTDVLMALLRRKAANKELRLVVMSATLDADRFSMYFSRAPVLYVAGRQFSVDVFFTVETPADILETALATILQVHESWGERAGDILVF